MRDANTTLLNGLVPGIEPVSEFWREQALRRLDTLTKPLGSLGQLEAVAAQFVAARRERWLQPIRKGVYIFAADHGVTAEGVSAYPGEVTAQMVLNFLRGGAAINVLARIHDVALTVIDVGVAVDFNGLARLLHRKVARGTRNLRREPAMSDAQLAAALEIGASVADMAASAGENLIAVGEMGIGNTTAASAVTCALTGAPAKLVTGHGTGIVANTYAHKIDVVQQSVQLHFGTVVPAPLDVLRCVGGLEIAGMVGSILQAARHQLVVVIDGFIAAAAAAIAAAIAPATLGYMVAGHCSEEPGHRVLLQHLQLRPLLTLNMRLGEGTGAVLAMPLVESAVALYREMATFESAGVSEASA